MKRTPPADTCAPGEEATTTRDRILNAAFAVLHERGYAATSTREIAARAKLSKRELYTEFGSKDGIFGALIAARAARMRQPIDQVEVVDRETLAVTLRRVGVGFLTQLCDPAVVSIFRLAASAAEQSSDMSRVLDANARAPYRQALTELMHRARSAGLLAGEPAALAGRFLALLTGDLHVPLLLGLADTPTAGDLDRHVGAAAEAFLQLHGTQAARPARGKAPGASRRRTTKRRA